MSSKPKLSQNDSTEPGCSLRTGARFLHRLVSGVLGILVAIAGLGILVYGLDDLSWSGSLGQNNRLGEMVFYSLPGIVLLAIALGGFFMGRRFIRFAIKGKR